jgi:hypothetical protein
MISHESIYLRPHLRVDRYRCARVLDLLGVLAADALRSVGNHPTEQPRGQSTSLNTNPPKWKTMPRNLYSPRLSDDVVRALYREGQRQRKPMTRVADDLLRNALAGSSALVTLPNVDRQHRTIRTKNNPN